MDLSEISAFALSVAREAADLVMRILPEAAAAKDVRRKGPLDLVTRADYDAERLIAARIQARFPHHGVLAEEGTTVTGESRWLVDPVDGTANFAHGFPLFAVSIAFEDRGALQCGVVAVPPLSEFFVAERGRGAYLTVGTAAPVKLSVSPVDEIGSALITTGLPGEPARSAHIATLPPIMRAAVTRITGSAAVNLAYIAAGRVDAFWEPGLNAWDVAAGVLLVEEAGGRVTDLTGRPLRAPGGDVLATNGALHAAMLEVIRG
ncbi:MAG: inositol monophosphatase family protein [Armatimonadota bacterium]